MENYLLCVPAFFAFIGKNYLRVYSAYKGGLLHRKYYKHPEAITDGASFYVIGPIDQAHNIGKRLSPERYAFFQGTCASLFDGFLRYLPIHEAYVRSRPADLNIKCWEM
jgi:hypothetical protein